MQLVRAAREFIKPHYIWLTIGLRSHPDIFIKFQKRGHHNDGTTFYSLEFNTV